MKTRTTFLSGLLLMALVFSLSAQLERDVFGSDSSPELCWALYQKGEGPSLETLRFYSFPPAWKDEQQTPERSRMVNIIAFNEPK